MSLPSLPVPGPTVWAFGVAGDTHPATLEHAKLTVAGHLIADCQARGLYPSTVVYYVVPADRAADVLNRPGAADTAAAFARVHAEHPDAVLVVCSTPTTLATSPQSPAAGE